MEQALCSCKVFAQTYIILFSYLTVFNERTDYLIWLTRAIFLGNIAEQCNFEARILPSATISRDRKNPIEIALLRNFKDLVKINR
jgi:hypothetical protein